MKQLYYIAFRAMGCDATVQLQTEADGNAILSAIPAQVEALEAQLSRFRPTSDLMHLNASVGQWVAVGQPLFDNLLAAKQASLLTDGDFNPFVHSAVIASGYDRNFADVQNPVEHPSARVTDWHYLELRSKTREVRIPANTSLDLGGIAKGWTVQYIADWLAPYGSCLVNIGGDMVARGAPDGEKGWLVTIEDPRSQKDVASLYLCNHSLVTSGTDFRRWQTQQGIWKHHIIDPHTGYPAISDVVSVTIHHPDATLAEAYAKAVLIRGAQAGLEWLQTQWHVGGLVVMNDGMVVATENFVDLMLERDSQ